MTEIKSWLWPDHVIGKKESRRLRDEHNALVNDYYEAVAAVKLVLEAYAPNADWSDPNGLHSAVRAAGLVTGAIKKEAK